MTVLTQHTCGKYCAAALCINTIMYVVYGGDTPTVMIHNTETTSNFPDRFVSVLRNIFPEIRSVTLLRNVNKIKFVVERTIINFIKD